MLSDGRLTPPGKAGPAGNGHNPVIIVEGESDMLFQILSPAAIPLSIWSCRAIKFINICKSRAPPAQLGALASKY